MKPVLIVEGKQYDVAQINYHNGNPTGVGVFDEHGNYKIYHDEKENLYIEAPLKIDVSECLKWQGRYDEVYETLDKVIVDNQTRMQLLANEIADHDNSFIPCPQKDERNKLKLETVGLIDAQEIVHGFMVDDVDLTGGGEEIE